MSSPCLSSENDTPDPGTSRRGSSLPEKSCKVCGDRAVGYNFSVITCESCKAFFRRNAHRQQALKCPFSQNCIINSLSRRFCQACRLQRCLQVGMKKEWIMRDSHRLRKHRLVAIPENDEETKRMFDQIEEDDVTVSKQVLMELVKKSNMRRLAACQCKCTCGFYPPGTRLIAAPTFTEQQALPPAVEIMALSKPGNQQFVRANQDICCPERSRSAYTITTTDSLKSTPQVSGSVGPELSMPSSGNISLSTTAASIQQAYISDDEYRAANAFERLSADDKLILQELLTANDILKQPLDLSTNHQTSGDLSLMDVVRMTDLAVRRIISMAKQLTFFKSLSSADQIALLKGSCSELLILRGVMVFDPSKRVWNASVAQGSSELEIKLDVLKRSKELEHYKDHKRFLATFGEKWGKNEHIMLLLNAITLFSPDRTNIQDKQKLQQLRQRYCAILQRYLGNLYVAPEAEKAYKELMQKLDCELAHLSESLIRIYHGLNANEMDPLLLELFDLSKH